MTNKRKAWRAYIALCVVSVGLTFLIAWLVSLWTWWSIVAGFWAGVALWLAIACLNAAAEILQNKPKQESNKEALQELRAEVAYAAAKRMMKSGEAKVEHCERLFDE